MIIGIMRGLEALPDRFGKYHVLSRIAQGGMAEVYKVKTIGLAGFEKVQALKRILPAVAGEPRFIRSFIDEARIAVELNHRNIVQVYDFGKAGGELYLAMELIEGHDLRTVMAEAAARGLTLPTALAAYVIAEVAGGLDYAHRKTDAQGHPLGIVHCDVSPANVMLSLEGFVKVLDFGVARASFGAAPAERRLRGKPRYMAPEQTRGETPTAATDVFALAVVAWELLASQPLFDGPDLASILAAVRRAEVPAIDRVNPAVPAPLAEAIARALDVAPARRGTAADLAAAAARATEGVGARALAAWIAHLESIPPRRDGTATSDAVVVPGGAGEAGEAGEADAGDGAVAEETADTAVGMAERLVAIGPPPAGPLTGALGIPLGIPMMAADWGDDVTRTRAQAAYPLPSPEGASEPAVDPLLAGGDGDDEPPTRAGMPAGFIDASTQIAELLGAEPLEAIDEQLGAPAMTQLRERRRVVVVAIAFDGGDVERRAALARTLVALAYKRGGVLLGGDDQHAQVAFGLEIAGEDDVATAVAFAVDAEQVARETRGAGTPGVRVGARAGVAAQLDDAGRHRVPADAIEEARALAREAQPGRPLLAGGAGRLSAAHFAFREVPARRGLHRRARVFEVLGPRSFDDRDRALLARRGRFVGRVAALAELDARLEAVIAGGTQQRVLVRGPAGVGKSRLCAEFVARAGARDAPPTVIATAATPATTVLPYGLIVDLVQAWLGLPPGRGRDARGQIAGRLHHVLTRAGAAPAAVADAAHALDAAMELRDGAAMGEVPELRARVAAAVELLRVWPAGAGPRIVVIEDLHLADAPSLDVLRAARVDRSAELLIATARPDATGLPRFEAVIDLADLVGVELRALVIDRLGEAATPLAVAAVIARAGGNPLFVEELAAAVRESGEGAVPATARDVIAARVDRLSPLAKQVLQFAAVAGAMARARILEELVGVGELSEPLDELAAEGLLIRADDAAPSAGEGDLAFARGLVREVVYDSLAAGARRDAHVRVGKLLASRFFAGREEPPAVIAEHLERGGELAAAAAFWLRAGRLSLVAGDADGALAYFDRTLRLEAELGAEPPTPASRARRAEAATGRADALRMR